MYSRVFDYNNNLKLSIISKSLKIVSNYFKYGISNNATLSCNIDVYSVNDRLNLNSLAEAFVSYAKVKSSFAISFGFPEDGNKVGSFTVSFSPGEKILSNFGNIYVG